MSNERRAIIFGLGAVLCWSTVATAFKLALGIVDTYQLLFYATLTATSLLGVAAAWRHGGLQTLLRQFRAHWRVTLIAGALNPLIYYNLLFRAYDVLPAQVALSINYTWAIVLTLMAVVFLKQNIRALDFLVAGICYFGVLIIATGGDLAAFRQVNMPGVLLAVASTFAWAGYWIINVRDGREPVAGLFLNFLVALPVTALACYLFSGFTVPATGIAASAYIGVTEMAAGFLFWSAALRLTTNASRVSNLIFLSPFASLVFIYFILGEAISPATLVGLALIVGGLLAQQLTQAGPAEALKNQQ